MRMRKKKNGVERMNACSDYLVKSREDIDSFSENQPLMVEIGCGKGAFILEIAKRYPDNKFIAMERVHDVALLAVEKIKAAGLENVRVLVANASDLREYFNEGQVLRIYLNFSDPWPKSRYYKRRLTYRDYLKIYKFILCDGGEIFFKTDNRNLFDFSLGEFSEAGFEMRALTYDLHNSEYEKDNIHTEYEDNFSAKGFTINRVEAFLPINNKYREKIMEVKILEGECWYGPNVVSGNKMPIKSGSGFKGSIEDDCGGNQAQPLFLSNKGRYIWCDYGVSYEEKDGVFTVTSKRGTVAVSEGHENLRGAFKAAQKALFPSDEIMPPVEFFTKPQFNTWIELIYDQNQKDILAYAHAAVDNGFDAGVLMIDDMWSNYYGKWDFDRAKFPDPKAMMDELHELGFKVILWVCPYVSLDSAEYRDLSSKGAFIRNADGSVRYVCWWNGVSACLDLTNDVDRKWFKDSLDSLMQKYGVDGFKFDAGDSGVYSENDLTAKPTTPNGQSELYAEFGLNYPYNEYRACYKNAGKHLVQRLSDKGHSWGDAGLALLIPNSLMQGILGYAYSCPDMVGGGSFADFLPGAKRFDSELFLRYAAASTLLPMIQFSAAPWRVLTDDEFDCIKSLMELRKKYIPLILELAENARLTGEPIVRYLEYVFPGEGLECVTDEFMLGDNILVAPVIEKGVKTKKVILPSGKWSTEDGTVYDGGTTVEVSAPLNYLPVFTRV